jgi:hypothetical protein
MRVSNWSQEDVAAGLWIRQRHQNEEPFDGRLPAVDEHGGVTSCIYL